MNQPINKIKADITPVKAHEAGKKAKTEGKHPVNDNPFNIVRQGHLWDCFMAGWEGKPCPYDHGPCVH